MSDTDSIQETCFSPPNFHHEFHIKGIYLWCFLSVRGALLQNKSSQIKDNLVYIFITDWDMIQCMSEELKED